MSERRINRAPTLPVILIALGGLFLISVLGYGYYNLILSNPKPASLPEIVAEFSLQRHVFGTQAVDEINQLHRLEFPLSSGAVGIYGENGEITIWVSGAPAKWMAARLTNDMEERIAEANSPFSALDERDGGYRLIYEVDGLGQKHFYFQSGKLLIWLAADHAIAEDVLIDTLEFYP
ncbi:MAG: hypothetical protein ISR58_04505 [Anaerolineales bacterium]|nr:hypothetical protein [Chloroflexota bacterium]MBL6980433.1 hypothetical protein [Anaerolineales bacterium]